VLDGLVNSPRALITGAAGSGKTVLAIEEAVRAAGVGKKVFLCCFNRQLGDFLMKSVAEHPEITATSLHRYMRRLIDDAGLQDRLVGASTTDLMAVFYPSVAVDALIELELAESFDLIVVDEAQDLLQPQYLQIFEALLRGGLADGAWRFFYDPKQNLFDGIHPSGLGSIREVRPAEFALTLNCRNTKPIAVMTCLLSGATAGETLVAEGPEVDTLWHRNPADALRRVSRYLNRLLGSSIDPEQIVILSRRALPHSSMAPGLVGVPYPLRESPLLAPGSIRFATTSAFKGLESDVVVLVDVDDLDTSEALSSVYVGTSRARAILAIAIDERARVEYEERAKEFGRQMARL
jgi:hypothetical protein